MKRRSAFLKLAIFATGVSGLVAEFIFSTLAAYFIGDTIVQWTVVLSIMLFSMGLGSRLSQQVKGKILLIFFGLELVLSLLISLAPLLIYGLAGQTQYIHILIYGMAALVGCAIGFEIPLVARLNEEYDSLSSNISSILSFDYVGSLVGGIAFAFWGLPYLGIKTSAFLFGMFNLMAALAVVVVFWKSKELDRVKVITGFSVALVLLALGFSNSEPIKLYGEQSRFKDKIVYAKESKYQKLTVTTWLNQHWLYINGNLQTTTLDEFMYHEPMIHPAMSVMPDKTEILIIGGGDGMNLREILKYSMVRSVELVDLDPEMTRIGAEFPPFVEANDSAFYNEKVRVLNEDGFVFLQNTSKFYDLIVVDLPDAKGVDLSKLYSLEFYRLAKLHLRPRGMLVTQSGNPYLATRAFYCIQKTMQAAGFKTLALHNHIPSMGEWSWTMGSRDSNFLELPGVNPNIKTRWLNEESLEAMSRFGKPLADTSGIEINTINNPVLYGYQLNGTWQNY